MLEFTWRVAGELNLPVYFGDRGMAEASFSSLGINKNYDDYFAGRAVRFIHFCECSGGTEQTNWFLCQRLLQTPSQIPWTTKVYFTYDFSANFFLNMQTFPSNSGVCFFGQFLLSHTDFLFFFFFWGGTCVAYSGNKVQLENDTTSDEIEMNRWRSR